MATKHGTAFINRDAVIKVKDLMALLEYRIDFRPDNPREPVRRELKHLKDRLAAHCHGIRDITDNSHAIKNNKAPVK
jgi:hypothetical protein